MANDTIERSPKSRPVLTVLQQAIPEDNRMNGNQRLYAAAARGRDSFCVALVESDPDDPHRIVLSHDGALHSPEAG